MERHQTAAASESRHGTAPDSSSLSLSNNTGAQAVAEAAESHISSIKGKQPFGSDSHKCNFQLTSRHKNGQLSWSVTCALPTMADSSMNSRQRCHWSCSFSEGNGDRIAHDESNHKHVGTHLRDHSGEGLLLRRQLPTGFQARWCYGRQVEYNGCKYSHRNQQDGGAVLSHHWLSLDDVVHKKWKAKTNGHVDHLAGDGLNYGFIWFTRFCQGHCGQGVR